MSGSKQLALEINDMKRPDEVKKKLEELGFEGSYYEMGYAAALRWVLDEGTEHKSPRVRAGKKAPADL